MSDQDQYLRAVRQRLTRDDLRVFTYLRTKDCRPFWELVAPDTGTTVMYNEQATSIWSFFRPASAVERMTAMETWWIEVLRSPTGWQFEENWRWRP